VRSYYHFSPLVHSYFFVGYLYDVVNLLSLGLVESSETNVLGSLLILEP
jgi:hypothetical protein